MFGVPHVAPENVLEVEKEGTGASEGRVTSTPAGIECGATCSHAFPEGETVKLTETPEGTTFEGWTGCSAEPSASECEVVMSEAKTVKAKFWRCRAPEFKLSVSVTGGGEVTSSGTVKCKEGGSAGECSEEVKEASTVKLKEKAAPGSKFEEWSQGRARAAKRAPVNFRCPAKKSRWRPSSGQARRRR